MVFNYRDCVIFMEDSQPKIWDILSLVTLTRLGYN